MRSVLPDGPCARGYEDQSTPSETFTKSSRSCIHQKIPIIKVSTSLVPYSLFLLAPTAAIAAWEPAPRTIAFRSLFSFSRDDLSALNWATCASNSSTSGCQIQAVNNRSGRTRSLFEDLFPLLLLRSEPRRCLSIPTSLTANNVRITLTKVTLHLLLFNLHHPRTHLLQLLRPRYPSIFTR